MKKYVAALVIFGWFFMFKVPHPDLAGITLTVLVGFFKDKQSCTEEYNKIGSQLPDLPEFNLTECEQAEGI